MNACSAARVFTTTCVSLVATVGIVSAAPAFAPVADGCWVRVGRTPAEARPSPLDSTTAAFGPAELKVCYGRPSMRGRVIMGGLVPLNQPWRLGANEATTIRIPVAVTLGDLHVPAGFYSLYTIPGETSWEIVVNSDAERWGIPINPGVRAHDVGSVRVATERTDAPVETLTIRLERAPDHAGVLLVAEWERTRVRVPLRPS